MPKDSQLDPKEVRKQKSKGGPTSANEALDNEGRNSKKQSIKKQGFKNDENKK